VALFTQSSKAVSAACTEIADTIGASADTDMTNRAWRSLKAAFQHFNNRKWDYLRAEAPPVAVYAPFTVTGVTASAGSTTFACPTGHGININDIVTSVYIPSVVRVSATAAGSFSVVLTTSMPATTAVDNPQFYRDMYAAPADWKAPYTARLQMSNRPLTYIGRRHYDKSVVNEVNNTTTFWYDLFMIGNAGMVRLLAPPLYNDVLQLRYYRRMTIPSASGITGAIDIIEDYEPYLMSWAKWHFLVDKGEGRGEQAKTWFALATEGIKTMLADQSNIPDEGLMFLPGASQPGQLGDNTTRWIWFDYS